MGNLYRIRNVKNQLLWSNEWGWGGAGYDTFDQEERNTLNLPIDGVWEQDTPLTILDQMIFESLGADTERLDDWGDSFIEALDNILSDSN